MAVKAEHRHIRLRWPNFVCRQCSIGAGVDLDRDFTVDSSPVIVSERDLFLGRSASGLWLERRLCRHADAMIVNSQRAGLEVERLVPGWRGRIHLVRNGVRLTPLGTAERRQAERLRAESMPNAILESYAAGRPVIATAVGDIARVVASGQSGWLVPPDQVRDLSAAIGRFVQDPPGNLHRMGAEDRRRVAEGHRLDQLCQGTLAVYRQVIDRRAAPPANQPECFMTHDDCG